MFLTFFETAINPRRATPTGEVRRRIRDEMMVMVMEEVETVRKKP